jgi:putative FmdB family regulatory protein
VILSGKEYWGNYKMPLYNYKCQQCCEISEVKLQIKDLDKWQLKCKCGGELKRIFSAVPAVYKVGGFYSTDYKGGGK